MKIEEVKEEACTYPRLSSVESRVISSPLCRDTVDLVESQNPSGQPEDLAEPWIEGIEEVNC